MTIIVGYVENGKVYIGGDSQASSGWDKIARKDCKVFVANNIAYGFTSSYRMGQILQYHSSVVEYDDNDTIFANVVKKLVPMWREILKEQAYTTVSNGVETGGTFLVGLKGKLFKIDSDFQVCESVVNYDACGCGSSYALGSLYTQSMLQVDSIAEDVITTAIESAKTFSNGCGGRIDIVSV